MPTSHISVFLQEATVPDSSENPLSPDCLYGLYTSWCLLHRVTPLEDLHFRDVLRKQGVDPGNVRRRITGPAAADYILASYPASFSQPATASQTAGASGLRHTHHRTPGTFEA